MRRLPVILCVLGAAAVADARVRWQTPGGYRLRATGLTATSLDETGAESGQRWQAAHRLRIRPSIEIDDVDIGLEVDVLTGQIAGDPNPVGADFAERRQGDPEDPERGWTTVEPRQAWVRWTGERGAVAFGQMGADWGIGLLDADGQDRDPGPWVERFGDRWYGDLVDRLLLQGRPFWPLTTGPLATLTFTLGGDHVWQDERASFLEGDTAWRAFGAVEWFGEGVRLGLMGMHRWQTDVDLAEASLTYLDGYGEWTVPLYMFGADLKLSGEAVLTFGESARRATVSSPGGVERLALGWLGRVDLAWRCPRVALAIETGYASGDADPADEADRDFSF
ncbi:MAG: hypothetical protein KC613_26360, partial [Myxococcales bacterium]|nr:hypothetical protein [Myxococcales bacterium]